MRLKFSTLFGWALGFIALAVCLMPELAFADVTNTVGLEAKRIGEQTAQLPKLVAMGSYVIGTFCAVKALLALRGFLEEPDKNPLNVVIAYAVASSMLISLPIIIDITSYTIGSKQQTPIQSSSGSFSDSGE